MNDDYSLKEFKLKKNWEHNKQEGSSHHERESS